MAFELGPFEPVAPFQPDAEYLKIIEAIPGYADQAIIYLDITVSGDDVYDPGCLIIGDGEAELRWTTGDDFLRWLGSDANSRWGAEFRLGTGQC